jgi:hypothetical protein
MCSDCGCGSKAATTTIPVVENLLSENDRIASHVASTSTPTACCRST